MSLTSEVTIKKVTLPNGETLSYREREGGEKNVLLIHGNTASSKHWDLVIENMDSKYKLYAVDMRGFGQSTYNQPIRSIKDLSDDVKLFVDEIGLKDYSIVGWSTGGAVGMQFVADYPGACEKLVLLASTSTRGYPFFETTADGKPDFTKRLSSYEEVKANAGTIQNAYDTNNRDFLKAMLNMLIFTRNQPEAHLFEEYIDAMLTQKNLAEVNHSLNTFNISNHHNGLVEGNNLVSNIKIPVLVLHGDRDLMVTENMTKEIVEDIGKYATFVELKDSGHFPLVDDLDQLLNVVSEFVD